MFPAARLTDLTVTRDVISAPGASAVTGIPVSTIVIPPCGITVLMGG